MESTSTIFAFFIYFTLYSALLVSSPWCDLFFILVHCFRCLSVGQWDFYLGILREGAGGLSQCNPPPLSFLTLFPHLTVFTMFPCASFIHRCDTCHYYLLSSFLLFLSLGLLYQSHFWIHIPYIFLRIYNIACIGLTCHIWEKTCSLWPSEPG
jgi:hypothetical protein